MVEHRGESVSRDIAFGFAVDLVAKRHVVGGNGFGDSSSCSACLEENASGFLSCSDFGEGSVLSVVKIDGERFAISGKQFVLHVFG